MPIFRNKVLTGNQFTGSTPADGLFRPKAGSDRIQVRLNGLYYHTAPAGGPSDLTVSLQDPDDPENKIILFYSAVCSDIYALNAFLLPTEALYPWPLVIETTTLAGDAWLTIDYDFESTEGV